MEHQEGQPAFVEDIGDLSYAEFLAPGLIASQALFHATFDSTYGAYLRMETHHIYEAILFTPLGPADIVVGEVMWGATRALVAGAAVLTMAAAFGLTPDSQARPQTISRPGRPQVSVSKRRTRMRA